MCTITTIIWISTITVLLTKKTKKFFSGKIFTPLRPGYFLMVLITLISKNRIHLSFWCVIKDMNRNLHAFFYLMKKKLLFLNLFVSYDFRNSKMILGKPQICPKIENVAKIIKIINVGFCDNSFNKSLFLILKYTVYEFYDYWTLF